MVAANECNRQEKPFPPKDAARRRRLDWQKVGVVASVLGTLCPDRQVAGYALLGFVVAYHWPQLVAWWRSRVQRNRRVRKPRPGGARRAGA